jgi:hypothetical protein
MGIDASGNAVSIWEEFDGENTNIQVATLSKGGSWSDPVVLSSAPGNYNQANPQISVNLLGYAVAVWEEFNETSVVKASTMQVSGNWSAPVAISLPTFSGSQSPQIAVDLAGNAVAVWARHNGSFNVVQASTLCGNRWSTPIDISPTNADSSSPQVGVDVFGNAVAIWTEINHQIIQGASLPFGGAWSVFTNISSMSDLSNRPQVAVDPAGNAVATWTAVSGGNFFVQASTLPFEGSWALPVNISTVGVEGLTPEVKVDQSGNAIAMWFTPIGSDIFIQAALLPFGGSWSSPETISAAGGQAFDPQVAFDFQGNAIAVWDRFNGKNTSIQAATLPFEGSWSTPVDISGCDEDADFPQIAIDPAGYAVVGWIDETCTVIESTTWIPAPTVTKIDPKFGPTVGGNEVFITGTDFINVTGVSFGSHSALNFTVLSPTSIKSIAPPDTGAVYVTVTTLAGISPAVMNDLYCYHSFVSPPRVTHVIPNNGSMLGGRSVRITGANFINVSSVRFGNANALSFVVVSPTLIVAETPPGSDTDVTPPVSETVDVTITTGVGTSKISVNDRYTYNP